MNITAQNFSVTNAHSPEDIEECFLALVESLPLDATARAALIELFRAHKRSLELQREFISALHSTPQTLF